jgi:SulP family sulfate permease
MKLVSLAPFLDLAGYRKSDAAHDVVAGVGVGLIAVPQGVAYAMIAGLPPVMGLYAAAVPAIVGGLLRSSRHVVTGPSNALSLLVGTAIAASAAGSPVEAAITLAFVVGALQIGMGALRLGALVDYISRPVVLGYVTGAGVLILVGQLPNVTATGPTSGNAFTRVAEWAADLGSIGLFSALLATATAVFIVIVRRADARVPGALIAMAIGIVLAYILDLRAWGIPTVADLDPIPTGLPPLTFPNLAMSEGFVSAAVACTVLSLVEGTSVARSFAERTGQHIQRSVEFTGQGIANVAASLTGGYPTSGSIARTSLNLQLGARTRVAGMISGAVVLGVLLFLGPVVDHTPIPTLAGILLVIAIDLIDAVAIRRVLRAHAVDRLAFAGTVLGTFALRLDHAIYLGVVISLVMFLRRARLLSIRELVVDDRGDLREADRKTVAQKRCTAIRVLQVEGAMFFGAAGELRATLTEAIEPESVRVLIVRTKQAFSLDITTAGVVEAAAKRLEARAGRLMLVGVRARDMGLLERTGIAECIGRDNIFAAEPGFFVSMSRAIAQARALVGEHACGAGCPLVPWSASQGAG